MITFSDLKENFASTNESLQCFLPYCYYELPVVNAYMLTKKNEVIYSKSWYQLSYSWILMNLKSLLFYQTGSDRYVTEDALWDALVSVFHVCLFFLEKDL